MLRLTRTATARLDRLPLLRSTSTCFLPVQQWRTSTGARSPHSTLSASAPTRLHSRISCSALRLHRRPLSSSSIRREEAPPTSFADPSRPDLFYHLVQTTSPPSFALSFSPTAPSLPDAAEVIGWLPAHGAEEGEEAGLGDFKENPRFREVLHRAIQEGLAEGCDEVQVNGALQIQEGWMHIHDQRNPPPVGRIGDIDDIIGSVRVEDSKIVADTYEPMPSYRLCTADGVTHLTDGLAAKLKAVLESPSAH